MWFINILKRSPASARDRQTSVTHTGAVVLDNTMKYDKSQGYYVQIS